MRIQNDLSKKKTKKDHHKPKKIIAADRPHPNFRHFMVEKYEIKVYLNLLKLTKYERLNLTDTNNICMVQFTTVLAQIQKF